MRRSRRHLKKAKKLINSLPQGWTAVCQDESTMIYDSVVRAVWAKKGSTPIVLTTGSHKKTFLFGALSLAGKQLFRQYEKMNGDKFIDFLKQMKRKFRQFLLFMDKAPWHKSKKVKDFLEKNANCIKILMFPTASPEFNPVEECWRQGKTNIIGNRIPPSFKDMKIETANYYRTKRFKLNLNKYLCP